MLRVGIGGGGGIRRYGRVRAGRETLSGVSVRTGLTVRVQPLIGMRVIVHTAPHASAVPGIHVVFGHRSSVRITRVALHRIGQGAIRPDDGGGGAAVNVVSIMVLFAGRGVRRNVFVELAPTRIVLVAP